MGDCLITTNNEILLKHTKNLPAIMCVQRKAEKVVITEDELVKANKNSFGDTIGATTNKSQLCMMCRHYMIKIQKNIKSWITELNVVSSTNRINS